MIKILIADSYYLSRSGLYSILSKQPDFEIVCQTTDCNQLMADVEAWSPDVIVMDIRIQPTCTYETVQKISTTTRSKFLILANDAADSFIVLLLRAGAQGCIQKDAGEENLVQAIRDVAANKSPISPNIAAELLAHLRNSHEHDLSDCLGNSSLSNREIMVLRLLSEGLPNKIIGAQLEISERTVEAHVRNILKKLNATSRTHAAFLASKHGWLTTND